MELDSCSGVRLAKYLLAWLQVRTCAFPVILSFANLDGGSLKYSLLCFGQDVHGITVRQVLDTDLTTF